MEVGLKTLHEIRDPYIQQVYRKYDTWGMYWDTTVFSKETHIGLRKKDLKAKNDQNETFICRKVMTFFYN